MKFKIAFLIILSIFGISTCYSQETDSSNVIFDTVYVESAPVIITETVFISEPPKIKKHNNKYFFDIKLMEGVYTKNSISSSKSSFSLQNSYSSSITFGKEIGHFLINIGVGFKGLSVQNQSDSLYNLYGQKTVQILDTLDVYYQLANGVSTPKYVTQLVNKIEPYSYQKDSTSNQVSYLKYLEIPLSLGYKMTKANFTFEPSVGILSSILLATPSELKVLNAKSYFSLTGAMSVLYKLTDFISVGCSYHFQNNINSLLKDSTDKIASNNIGFNFRYTFK